MDATSQPAGPRWRVIGLAVVCSLLVAAAGGVLLLAGATTAGTVMAVAGLVLAPFIAWMGVLLAASRANASHPPAETAFRNSHFGFVMNLLREGRDGK